MRALYPIILGILLGLVAHAAAGQDVMTWTKVDYKGLNEKTGETFFLYWNESTLDRAIVVRVEGRLLHVLVKYADLTCAIGAYDSGAVKYTRTNCGVFDMISASIAKGIKATESKPLEKA